MKTKHTSDQIDATRRLAESYPRHGSERMHELLLHTGWRVNFKRVHRLWKAEQMQVPTKQHKKRRRPGKAANSCTHLQCLRGESS